MRIGGAVRSDDATVRARAQLQGQGKPTGDPLAHDNLLQQSDRAHIPWAARKLCLQLKANLQKLSRRRDGSLHQPRKGACRTAWHVVSV